MQKDNLETPHIGYEYLKDLSQAITTYTNSSVEKSSNAFIYRSANLQFAVERYLYFLCIGNSTLLTAYCNHRRKMFSDILRLDSMCMLRVGSYLLPNTLIKQSLSVRVVAQKLGLRNIRNAYRHLKNRLIRKQDIKLKEIANLNKYNVFFCVSDIKFAKYLRKIHFALGTKSSFLSISNQNLQRKIINEGMPCIDISLDCQIKNRTENELSLYPFLCELFDTYLKFFLVYKPSCVVVAEGNAPSDVIVSEVCRLLSIPVVCIQQGWSPFVHVGFKNMSFSKFLSWGDGFSTILSKYNPEQGFVSVGNHVLQDLAKNCLKEKKLDQITTIGFFIQSPHALLSLKDYLSFLELIKWTAKQYSNINVIVREHPNYEISKDYKEELKQIENIMLMSPDHYSLEKVLSKCEIIISVFSTTILEAIYVDVLPIICNISGLPHYYPDVDKMNAGIEVKTIDETKYAIERLINNPIELSNFRSGMHKFRTKFFEDKNSVDCISNEIRNFCSQKV